MKKIISSSWWDSKRECWRELKEYYNDMMKNNRWEYMDEFNTLYIHYENDLDGTLGYMNSKNEYGGPIRRLYLVLTGRMWKQEEIDDLKKGIRSIKDFDEDNLL